jgi:hypothetical protein
MIEASAWANSMGEHGATATIEARLRDSLSAYSSATLYKQATGKGAWEAQAGLRWRW